MSSLFTLQKIGYLEIKNRVVLPPMVCFTFAGENGFVSEKNIKHYEGLAKGGSGLIIVEATAVNASGRLAKGQLAIWSDEYIEGLSQIAKVCHDQGAQVILQIHHAGLRTPKNVAEEAVSSSDYNDGKTVARAMAKDEIHEVQKNFIEAAVRAWKAGFDGVELHGAHAYLMTQFFSSKVNKRIDEYGGSFENRLRFTTEIFHGIRQHIPEPFIVGIRMGCNENDMETSIAMAKQFEAIGMDYLHISTGFDNTPIIENVPEGFPGNWIVYGAAKIKEQVTIPVIAVNTIKTPEQAQSLIENNLVDMVAIGRGQLADYNFVNHTKEGTEIITCLGCKPCKWFTNGDYCPRHII